MKKYISIMILLIGLLVVEAADVQAGTSVSADQTTVKVENTATVTQEMGVVSLGSDQKSLGGFLSVNWGILSLSLLSFLEVVTRLTPSEKDNTVLSFLGNILNAIIPNLKKGGGRL